jgi:hypothetical protein
MRVNFCLRLYIHGPTTPSLKHMQRCLCIKSMDHTAVSAPPVNDALPCVVEGCVPRSIAYGQISPERQQ